MRYFVTILLLLSITIHGQDRTLTQLPFEKDLIPEGIAVDIKNQKVFFNSLRKNTILRCNLDGSEPEEFLEPNGYDYLSGFGMTIQGDTLYALGNSLPKKNNTSILLLLHRETGALFDSYKVNDTTTIYLNDLAVGEYGEVYITDSESDAIYSLNHNTKQLEVFFQHPEIQYSNGIALSDKGNLLYLASYAHGIRILNLATKELVNGANQYKGIDGMKYYNNHLVAIVNGNRDGSKNGVYRYRLSDDGQTVETGEKIMDLEDPSDIPTTLDIDKDALYFVADTQLDNFDQETNEIVDWSLLKPYDLVRLNVKTMVDPKH